MSYESLLKAFQLIEENKKERDMSGNKSDELIDIAEKKLSIFFPPSYKLFLKKYGCGGIRFVEIYGIINDDFENSRVPDAIWLTLDERKQWNLPPQFIIISDTGDGDWYALDSSKPNKDGEYPVVICHFDGENYHIEKTHEDFGEFLLEETEFALEDNPYEDDKEE